MKHMFDYLWRSFMDESHVRGYHKMAQCPTLCGAIVGGPDILVNDNDEDNRDDYQQDEVACDYNEGFQSALAVLFESKL